MESYMKRQGYAYYVYVRPGVIEYFRDYESAEEYAEIHDAEVQEIL